MERDLIAMIGKYLNLMGLLNSSPFYKLIFVKN